MNRLELKGPKFIAMGLSRYLQVMLSGRQVSPIILGPVYELVNSFFHPSLTLNEGTIVEKSLLFIPHYGRDTLKYLWHLL